MQTVALTLAVFLVHAAWELLRWGSWQPSGAAALLLLGGVGALVGVATDLIRKPRLRALVLVGTAIAVAATELQWAIRRASELSTLPGHIAVWLTGLSIAALCARLAHRATRPLSPVLQGVAAGAVGIGALAIALSTLQPFAPGLAQAWAWGALGLGSLSVVLLQHRRWWLLLVGIVALLALARVPLQYPDLYGALLALALSVHVVWATGLSKLATRSRLFDWISKGVVVALAVLCIAAAERRVSSHPNAWRAHPNRLGAFSTFARWGYHASDVDQDGHGVYFGQADCAPLDPTVGPGAHEVPFNEIDENCLEPSTSITASSTIAQLQNVNRAPAPWRRGGDVVLIVVDTLRLDATKGAGLDTFSKLREQSISFDNAYTTSTFTSYAMISILTGRVATAGALKWTERFCGYPIRQTGLHTELATLGYKTALVGGRDTSPYFTPEAFGHGFERLITPESSATADQVTDMAITTWESLGDDQPRFMWVHYMQVHDNNRTYAAQVKAVDAAIGRLIEALGDEVLTIVTSDHGEEFGEHGGVAHAQTLYQEVVRVPLYIRVPGRAPQTVEQTSSLRSLPNTVLALLGEAATPTGPYLCVGQADCADVPAFMALELQGIHLHALVHDDWKIIRDLSSGTPFAFDLARDPKELSPFFDIPDERLNALIAYEEELLNPRSIGVPPVQ